MIELATTPEGIRLTVKVIAGASRTRILGELDGALKVAIATPPSRGKANKALLTLLAKTLSLRRSQLRLIEGTTSPRKVVLIRGTPLEQVRQALDNVCRQT